MFRASNKLHAMGIQNASLEVEFMVIQLYTKNLSSIGIAAGNLNNYDRLWMIYWPTLNSCLTAVVAAIDMTGLNEIYWTLNVQLWEGINGCTPLVATYQTFYSASLVISVIVMVRATLALMFGPQNGLLGKCNGFSVHAMIDRNPVSCHRLQ